MMPLQRELLQELIAHGELTSTDIVELQVIDGSLAQIRAQEVSATEWLWTLEREGTLQSGARETAATALNITVGETEGSLALAGVGVASVHR